MADSIDLRFASTSRSKTIRTINCGNTDPRMGGNVDVSCYTSLEELSCSGNNITTVILVSSLEVLSARDNLLGSLTPMRPNAGSFPVLSACQFLQWCDLGQNVFTASIPELSANKELTTFLCDDNKISTWNGTLNSINPNLGRFEAQNNLLTTLTVDQILSAFDKGNRNSASNNQCILYLHEAGNQPPSFQGGILQTFPAKGFSQTGDTVTFSYPEDTPLSATCHALSADDLITIEYLGSYLTHTAVVNVPNLSSFSYKIDNILVPQKNVVRGGFGFGEVTIRTTLSSADGYRVYQRLGLPLDQTYQSEPGKGWDVRINQPIVAPTVIYCTSTPTPTPTITPTPTPTPTPTITPTPTPTPTPTGEYIDYHDGHYPPGS